MTVIFSTSHFMNSLGSSARIPSISVNSQKELCLNFHDVKKVKVMDSLSSDSESPQADGGRECNINN